MKNERHFKPSNISVEFFEEDSLWYMKWTILENNSITVIPKIGPVVSSTEEITYTSSTIRTPFFERLTEEFVQQLGHTYKLYPADVCVTDFDGVPHLCSNVTKVSICEEKPKKKMTLKEIEKELGYEIDLVEESV